jgi:hypothetical protein
MTMPDQPQDRTDQGEAGLAPTDQPAVPPGQISDARTLARYQLGEALAVQQHQVRDRVLDRRAIGRVVSLADADELENEARFLARLDHVGTPDVLDFVRHDAGAMLVMRRTDGITLAEAIAQSRGGIIPPELSTPASAVLMLLKVCDAISAAHAQGVVHHALAPERILLGGHGQVVVQDWSAAIAEKQNPATLRYVSAAPVGDRLALDGMHQDIRALGACLFAALVLRAPRPEGVDALGYLQPDERMRLPPQLESVIRQALASDPSSGYGNVAQLAQELTRFVDGLTPAAYRPGAVARLCAGLRRRRRPLLATASAIAVAVLAVGLIWGRQLQDWAAWRVVASEDFAGADWKKRWVEPASPRGMFAAQDGRLVSVADRDAFLIFRQRLTTPAAIEYTGEMLAGSQPCDLSVQWSEASGVAEDPARFEREGRSYMIQAGAFGNSFCAIYQNPGRRLMGHANRQLEPAKRYRFRVELDGRRISLAIDGQTVVEAEDEFPTRSGFISLYGFYPGKAFDDVRVMQRRPANPPSLLDAGDAAFIERRYEPAASLYARVIEAAGGSDAQDALFRKGLAEWHLGQGQRSAASWDRVTDQRLQGRIACIQLEALFNADQRTPHASWLEDRYREQPGQREGLRRDWRQIIQQQLDAPQRNLVAIDYLLGLRQRLFPEDESCRYVAAATQLSLRRFEEVLTGFPEQRNPCARAMLALGRTQDLVTIPWVGNDERNHALAMRGEFERMLEAPGLMPSWRARVLIRLNRFDEAMQAEGSPYPTLLHMGRAGELLEQPGQRIQVVNDALIAAGRLQEAAGDGLPYVPGSGSSVTAMLLLGQIDLAERLGKQPRPAIRFMLAAELGDDKTYAAQHDLLELPPDLGSNSGWFAPVILRPFVDVLHGNNQALEQQLRPMLPLLEGTFSKSAWYLARALLGDTPVESVGDMPSRYDAPAWQLVAAGMRAELLGQSGEARTAYAAFVALPMYRRLLNQHQPDTDLECFVAWRLRALKASP